MPMKIQTMVIVFCAVMSTGLFSQEKTFEYGGLEHVPELTREQILNVKTLIIHKMDGSDQEREFLSRFSNISDLLVGIRPEDGVDNSTKFLKEIPSFRNLAWLVLYVNESDEAVLSFLSEIDSLEYLSIEATFTHEFSFSDDFPEKIAQMSIERIGLTGAFESEEVISDIIRMPGLKEAFFYELTSEKYPELDFDAIRNLDFADLERFYFNPSSSDFDSINYSRPPEVAPE